MKAITHSRYGPPDALELEVIEEPSVNEDGVLVRVHAAAVGKGDWLTVQGLPDVARLRYRLPNPSTRFQASTWPGTLRRSAAT
jgi:NADPH:quinone reductase-like Zn-dependent oxidoreductase